MQTPQKACNSFSPQGSFILVFLLGFNTFVFCMYIQPGDGWSFLYPAWGSWHTANLCVNSLPKSISQYSVYYIYCSLILITYCKTWILKSVWHQLVCMHMLKLLKSLIAHRIPFFIFFQFQISWSDNVKSFANGTSVYFYQLQGESFCWNSFQEGILQTAQPLLLSKLWGNIEDIFVSCFSCISVSLTGPPCNEAGGSNEEAHSALLVGKRRFSSLST